MKKCFFFFLFVSLFLGSTGYAVELTEQIGHIKNTSGEVEIHRANEVLAASPGDSLVLLDKITTRDGSTGIIFKDGTMVSLGPNSEMDLERYTFVPKNKQYAFDLFLQKGTAVYTSGRLGKIAPDAVKLKTPRATVGIRGTKLILEVK